MPGCLTSLVCLLYWSQAEGAQATGATRDVSPWVVSADGQVVVNQRAKLAWSRCVEGMHWNGRTCTGQPILMTHGEAMARAAERRQKEGGGWRLPRVTELQRMVNRSARPPGPDPVLFPAAPRGWHWTMTANVNTRTVNEYNYGNVAQARTNASVGQAAFLRGWAVSLESGEASDEMNKRARLAVRLLKPAD